MRYPVGHPRRTPEWLRSEAYYAYLDGRVKQAKKYNREAAALERAAAKKKKAKP